MPTNPVDWASLATQTGQQALGGIMGLMMGNYERKKQLEQQQKLQQLQITGQKEMTDYQRQSQMQMWKDTNYPAQVQMLKQAGLNPALLYGMSGGGGTTAASTPGNVTGGQASGVMTNPAQMAATSAQLGLMRAQTRDLNASAATKEADLPVKEATVPNIQADTENKILAGIIAKYAGMEAKDVYEQIKKPNRGIQAKTYQDELEARQGIATTIYDMWVEGKLKDKSNAEVEQLLLQNAKTQQETRQIIKAMDLLEENIKGAKLDNIIKDLEARLQTETGIDRSSSGLLKILGRLFLKYRDQ